MLLLLPSPSHMEKWQLRRWRSSAFPTAARPPPLAPAQRPVIPAHGAAVVRPRIPFTEEIERALDKRAEAEPEAKPAETGETRSAIRVTQSMLTNRHVRMIGQREF
mmetsp:Transcript_41351/g.82868  ORF Transcript_41351/g.82868 Transcript_41351/m.82868 type:complete len:106 (+) Transcript_41351:1179-1496(+)